MIKSLLRSSLAVIISLFALIILTLGIAIPSDAQTLTTAVGSPFFGLQMNAGTVTRQPWPSVPFGSTRLWNSNTQWAIINTADGVYDWSVLDAWLDDAGKHDIRVLYTFGWTPRWASSKPNDQNCAGGPGVCDPPNDLNSDGSGTDQHWKDFVTALVNHNQSSSGQHIHSWEIWNEPYHTAGWNGTIAQMLRMAQDARTIIKAADPDAIVLSPSVVVTLDGRTWLESYLSAGGGNYADRIAVHGYVQGPGRPLEPEYFVQDFSNFHAVLVKYGQAKKHVWDTEASWGFTSVTNFTDPDMQAGFLARFYVLHWNAGVTRFYWYAWNDTDGTLWIPSSDPSGPGTLLEPGMAYGQTYQWLVGATQTSNCATSGPVWTCEFSRPDSSRALVVWDASQSCKNGVCTTSSYTFDPVYTKYRDLAGNSTQLTGSTVRIGAKPILLEN